MNFREGQVLRHQQTNSRWIVLDINQSSQEQGRKTLVLAYCLYSGTQPDYWKPNQIDCWLVGGAWEMDIDVRRWAVLYNPIPCDKSTQPEC